MHRVIKNTTTLKNDRLSDYRGKGLCHAATVIRASLYDAIRGKFVRFSF